MDSLTSGEGLSAPVASIACTSCRRLKMKCIGSDNPPCARCVKAGRPCIVQRGRPQNSTSNKVDGESRKHQVPVEQTPSHSFSSSGPHGSSSTSFPPVNGVAFGRENQIAKYGNLVARTFIPDTPGRDTHEEIPVVLPSIFTTSPYAAVVDDAGARENGESADPRPPKRPKFGDKRLSLGPMLSQKGISEPPITERDMVQFIDIFRKRIMNFIPLFNAGDLDDASNIISKKKPLAYCICYVTARYVPGGESTRIKLLPVISAILQERAFKPKDAGEEWTMLQSLSVLYAYRTAISNSPLSDGSLEISQRSIKAHIETYALNLSVHRSISGVKASLRTEDPETMERIAFKKYIFWLWLFNMSHHHSIVTGTPPSIREDSTIRAASEILRHHNVGPRIRQVLAEVELCLLWGKASVHARGIGEWWCPPDILDTPVDYIEQGVLANVDTTLKTWSDKWKTFFNSEPLGPGIEFHYRFTRFCLSAYLIRNLRLVGRTLSTLQVDALNRSISDASSFCQFSLELGPSSREAARYMADFGFVMMSFSCIFIIQACENFHSTIIQAPYGQLRKVEEVAHLLQELAINSSHGPSFQSQNIKAKLQQAYEKISTATGEDGFAGNLNADETLMYGAGQDAFFVDPQWDMLEFFPEFPQL